MKKIAILFIFIFSFWFVTDVEAFQFQKSQENPLKIKLDLGYETIQQTTVFKKDGLYKAVVSAKKPENGYHSLVLIESSDSTNWQMKKEVLVVEGQDISNPRIYEKEDGTILLLFAKRDNPDFYQIYNVPCTDDFECLQVPEIFFPANTANHWESHGYFAPYLFRYEGMYYLFYGSWGSSGFRTNMAYSTDLSDWQKCDNAVVYGGDGPFPYLSGDDFYLFVHQANSTGIQAFKTRLPLSCNCLWENTGYVVSKGGSYDSRHIIYPSIISDQSSISLFYSGLGQDDMWSLALAQNFFSPTPSAVLSLTLTPTPSPTLIPTPTLTLTPTPVVSKTPVVLIPGIMASWNKNALIHNETVFQDDWTMTPFVKEYDGLIKTFANIGYEKNDNFRIFNYDWRKPLKEVSMDLSSFLDKHYANSQEIYLIGHSLGGLVARTYKQISNDKRIAKIVSLGSPHKGVAQAYLAVSAGNINQDNTWLWLAQKIVIQLNKNSIMTDRQVIENRFKIAFDLLPTYNFLIDQKGQEIEIDGMSVKNRTLLDLENSFADIFPNLWSVAGEGIGTEWKYVISGANWVDNIFGNYKDGHPFEIVKKTGDGVVVLDSALAGNSLKAFNLNHSEIVYKKDPIKNILDYLGLAYQDTDIIEGQGTVISPSLIFLIKSPATIEVHFNGKKYFEQEGVIYIENAKQGQYDLLVKGLEPGSYQVIVGQIGQDKSFWNSAVGTISDNAPQSQTDLYRVDFNPQKPKPRFLTSKKPMEKLVKLIYFFKNRKIIIGRLFSKALANLAIRKNINEDIYADLINSLIDKDSYSLLNELEYRIAETEKPNSKKIADIQKTIKKLETKAKQKKSKKIIWALEKLEDAKKAYDYRDYSYADAILKSVSLILDR